MRRLVLVALFLVWAGCDATAPASVGDLTLDVSGRAFATNVQIGATVRNETDRTLLLFDCGGRILLDVQRQTATGWETVSFVNNDCPLVPLVPYRLGAGQHERVAFRVQAPGTYRLQTAFGTVAGPGTDVGREDWVESLSEPFVVSAP